jgi:hypothetical protein
MKRISRKLLADLSDQEVAAIESFLDTHFSTVFHDPAFSRILAEHLHTDFSYNILYNENGEIIALCPQHSIRSGIVTRTYSNPPNFEAFYGGWVYDKAQASLEDLMKMFRLSFCESLTYWSMPQIDNNDYRNIDDARVWQTPVIDLSAGEDEIWMETINQKRRNMVRKARKSDVTVRMGGKDLYDAFYSLMEGTYLNAGISLKPRDYYHDILAEYFGKGNGLLLLAEMDSVPVSGIIVLRNRHVCNYWIGASDKSAKNMGQGELLHWEAIKWARDAGSQYYDLSIVNPDALPHIAKFKLGLSRNTVPFYSVVKRNIGYRILSRLGMQA